MRQIKRMHITFCFCFISQMFLQYSLFLFFIHFGIVRIIISIFEITKFITTRIRKFFNFISITSLCFKFLIIEFCFKMDSWCLGFFALLFERFIDLFHFKLVVPKIFNFISTFKIDLF
mmetsp:Transcript_64114/g.182019  ORF Transcript_64114/g.182019 Transcript_64114/m.182019 type:complete len:118 (+) Transcript_64114:176-529(+)